MYGIENVYVVVCAFDMYTKFVSWIIISQNVVYMLIKTVCTFSNSRNKANNIRQAIDNLFASNGNQNTRRKRQKMIEWRKKKTMMKNDCNKKVPVVPFDKRTKSILIKITFQYLIQPFVYSFEIKISLWKIVVVIHSHACFSLNTRFKNTILTRTTHKKRRRYKLAKL